MPRKSSPNEAAALVISSKMAKALTGMWRWRVMEAERSTDEPFSVR